MGKKKEKKKILKICSNADFFNLQRPQKGEKKKPLFSPALPFSPSLSLPFLLSSLLRTRMADPARDLDRGLAARLRWAAMVLGSAMMMVGLACFLAISASKKSGRASTISSLFLLQFLQNLGTFFSVYPLGALTLLMFIARAGTYWSRIGRRAHGVGLPLVQWRISGHAAAHGRPGEGVEGVGEAMAVTSTGERGLQRGDEEEIAETRTVDIEECLPRTFDTAKGKRVALANP